MIFKSAIVFLLIAALTARANPFLPILAGSPPSSADSLLTDLMFYYTMNEAAGAGRSDYSGFGNTLTETGGSTVGSAAFIKSNGADFEYDDTDDVLGVSDNANISLGSDTALSFVGWFKIESNSGVTQPIFCKSTASGAATEYMAWYSSSSPNFNFRVGNNVSFQTVSTAAGTLQVGATYFFYCYHDPATDVIGVQLNRGVTTTAAWSGGTFDGTSDLEFGRLPYATANQLDGIVDEVGGWKRLLTSDEVDRLFKGWEGNTLSGVGGTFESYAAADYLSTLAAYWKLDEGSGNAIASYGGIDLTDNNTVTVGVGKVGNARQFTAASSERFSTVDNATLSMGSTTDFTIVVWVNPDTVDANRDILSKWGGGGSAEYLLWYLSGSGFRFSVYNGTTQKDVTATTHGVATAGNWYCIIAWHDSVNDIVGIGINGVENTSAWTGGCQDGAAGFAIGLASASAYWNGRIDETAIFKSAAGGGGALSSAQRTAIYRSGNAKSYKH